MFAIRLEAAELEMSWLGWRQAVVCRRACLWRGCCFGHLQEQRMFKGRDGKGRFALVS